MKKATLALVLVVIGLVIFGACKDISDGTVNTALTSEATASEVEPEIAPLEFKSLEEVEQHFIGLWREQYLTKNGFEPSEDLQILCSAVSSMFKTEDGKIVSRGSLPYETEAILAQYGTGKYESIDIHRVYQIVGIESGKIYDAVTYTGEFFYSGNRLDTLLDDLESDSDTSVLSSTYLGNLVIYVDICQICTDEISFKDYAKEATNW